MPFISSSGRVYRMDGPQRGGQNTAKVLMLVAALLLSVFAFGTLGSMAQKRPTWRVAPQYPSSHPPANMTE